MMDLYMFEGSARQVSKKTGRAAICFLLVLATCLTGCSRKQEEAVEVPVITPTLTVDFGTPLGEFKPVNGINNGPKSKSTVSADSIEWSLDATKIYKDLAIPFVRTHDSEYPDGSGYFIDIHCIFPDTSKETDDPKAYDFRGTDEYIANIRESGAEVFYRLGESIAPSVDQATYQYPPEDYQKWAEVCAHIIAHYNDGWAEGFNYGIQYWEIWNEPDMPRQWIGEVEEYYDLYKTTARYLKELYPDIKIGGGVLASAEEEPVTAFLQSITDDGKETPLDFFSWHLYTPEPQRFTYRANLVRKLLDQYGYTETETFADEWNYIDDWDNIETTWDKIRSGAIASFCAASLITLQNSAVDGAMYYDGSLTGEYASWCGLYTDEGSILSGYYAFQAFAQMREAGEQVSVTFQRDPTQFGVFICAGSGSSDMILLANTSDEILRFQLNSNSGKSIAEILTVNNEHPQGLTQSGQPFSDKMMIEMKPWEMQFYVLSK